MSSWRAMADDALQGRDTRDARDTSLDGVAGSGAFVPNVPTVPAPLSSLRFWRTALAGLDSCEPRGMPMGRWQTLYDASVWWLESFGRQAALDGWSTGDVFGVRPGYPGTGGLIDRLGDNRSLVMTADRGAWRSLGVAEKFNRTAGDGLLPWWEV